jgi:hypothetical protein
VPGSDAQYWIRTAESEEPIGPYDQPTVLSFASAGHLTTQDQVSNSREGPWLKVSDVPGLAGATRSAVSLLPQLICIAGAATLGFAAPRLTGNAIDGLRFVVAGAAFGIAVYYEDTPHSPRWLFALLGAVFLIPARIPLNRGGWLVLDWLAACASMIHGRFVIKQIERRTLAVRIADGLLKATAFLLFLTVFAILRCEGSGEVLD